MLSYAERANLCANQTAKKLFSIMEEKRTNLALAADVTTSDELIHLADTIGHEICLFKTHIDIVRDFTPRVIAELRSLAKKHTFLIFEDRKFADIGNTVKEQYAGGIYRISEWADIVNAHILPGPGIIQGLKDEGRHKERGLILIAEMSSSGSFATTAYAEETVRMANEHDDFVIGFIAMEKISDDPRHIVLTPGVQFSAQSDALGQRYRTPEEAIGENGSDIIIVGRGVVRADDPLRAAKQYREAGWQAYKRLIH